MVARSVRGSAASYQQLGREVFLLLPHTGQYDCRMRPLLLVLLCILPAACSYTPTLDDNLAAGDAHLEAGDYSAAIEFYDDVLEYEPRHAKALNNRGFARASTSDLAGAIADYNACLSVAPTMAEALYNRGVARYRIGERGQAVMDLTEAISIQPSYTRAYAARGLILSAGGDSKSAQADFKKALELAPQDWPDRARIEAELESQRRATPK